MWAIAAILANASPLKPLDLILYKSFADDILDVACLLKQILASSLFIPIPSSETKIEVFPAFLISTWIFEDLASIEFSNNSFNTDAGLWTTSPAAIWLATFSGSMFIIFFTNKKN